MLGLGLALTLGVLNAIWYEIKEGPKEVHPDIRPNPPDRHCAG